MIIPTFPLSHFIVRLPEPLPLSLGVEAQQPDPIPALTWQWSASGQQYALVTFEVEPLKPSLWVVMLAGVQIPSNAPVTGIGLSYQLNRERWYAGVTAGLLFPQNQTPDLSLGLSIGFRF